MFRYAIKRLTDSLAIPHVSRLDLFVALFVPVLVIAPLTLDILGRFDYSLYLIQTNTFQWRSHFLYPLLLSVGRLLTGDWMRGQAGLMLVNYAILGLVIYLFLAKQSKEIFVKSSSRFKFHAATLGLLLISPVYLLYFYDHQLYFGYVVPTVYHSPSMLLLKPIAVLHLFWMDEFLNNPEKSRDRLFLVLGSIIIILTALIKPSYAIAILPILGLYVLTKRSLLWPFIIAVAIPVSAILLLQAAVASGQGSFSVTWAPLLVLSHYTEIWTLFPKVLLSILFPLFMLFTRFRLVATQRLLFVLWAAFVLSLFYALFISESGDRTFDGNWIWSSQICSFLLFVAYTRWLLGETIAGNIALRSLPWLMFVLHSLSGLAWYLIQFTESPVSSYW